MIYVNSKEQQINEENLLKNGFQLSEYQLSEHEEDKMQIYHLPLDVGSNHFYISVDRTSNTPGRDWNMTVDNDRFESVAMLNIATYDQMNAFLNLLEE